MPEMPGSRNYDRPRAHSARPLCLTRKVRHPLSANSTDRHSSGLIEAHVSILTFLDRKPTSVGSGDSLWPTHWGENAGIRSV